MAPAFPAPGVDGLPNAHWQVTGVSVRGATHIRRAKPNQDALQLSHPETPGTPAILAIADGHGSARYVRSQNGAKFAVRVVVELLQEFAVDNLALENLSALKEIAESHLPARIVHSWRAQVLEHLRRKPFTSEETAQLFPGGPPDPPAEGQLDPHVRAYGTTLLAALLAPSYLLFLQLGDGDILTVDSNGVVSRPPIPHDPRIIGNQTTSLSGSNAWQDMRIVFQPLATRPPALIMLATDGYANSFVDEENFFCAGADLLAAWQQQSSTLNFAARLRHWLRETSTYGSGDDITVALAFCDP
jgi:hypothetical protein